MYLDKITVIVTSFNQAETLPQTLDCILQQKCSWPIEIIIGDDCSTDETRTVCERYQANYPDVIRPIFHTKNGGVAANFVLSVNEAKGKYIAICAADDYWHNPNKLQIQLDYFISHPECGLIYTDYDRLHTLTGKLTHDYLKLSNIPIYEGENLIQTVFKGKFPALTLTVMFRKDLYDKYIPWQDYIRLRFTLEDWPTWLILSHYSSVAYIPESTATYRYGHVSLSNTRSYEKILSRFEREKQMYVYLCSLFPNELSYDEQVYDNYVSSVLLELAYKRSDYRKAKEFASSIRSEKKTIKQLCTRNYLSFIIFSWLKKHK